MRGWPSAHRIYSKEGKGHGQDVFTEKDTTLGLKSVPLAVLALTVCKNLVERIEQLENK